MKAQSLFTAAAMVFLCVVANANQSDFGQRSDEKEKPEAATTNNLDASNPAGVPNSTDSSGPTPSESIQSESMVKESRPKKASGRLPRYFAAIVNPVQRQQIYAVQTSFRLRKEKLQQELDELKQVEMQEIQNLLTEPQMAQLTKLRQAAQQRLLAKKSSAAVKTGSSN